MIQASGDTPQQCHLSMRTLSRMRLFGVCCAALLGAALASTPAAAQSLEDILEQRKEQLRNAPKDDAEAEAKQPRLSAEEELELAYANLLSDEEPVWKAAEKKIIKSWSRSGSDSMDLLLTRGLSAMKREDWEAALEHLTDLVNLAPEFAEGWSMRATVHYRQKRLGPALADLAEAINRDPRHFGAYTELGLIFEQIDEPSNALAAYRKALEIHPNLEASLNGVKRLANTAEGRPI